MWRYESCHLIHACLLMDGIHVCLLMDGIHVCLLMDEIHACLLMDGIPLNCYTHFASSYLIIQSNVYRMFSKINFKKIEFFVAI